MRKRDGFTLLEVLVATLLMGIAITGLLSTLRVSLNNANRQTETERGIALARRQMDELLATRWLAKNRQLEGHFDPATTGGVEAGWQAVVTFFEWAGMPEQQAPGGGRVMERIHLQVWWMEGHTRRQLELESYRGTQLEPRDMAGGQ